MSIKNLLDLSWNRALPNKKTQNWQHSNILWESFAQRLTSWRRNKMINCNLLKKIWWLILHTFQYNNSWFKFTQNSSYLCINPKLLIYLKLKPFSGCHFPMLNLNCCTHKIFVKMNDTVKDTNSVAMKTNNLWLFTSSAVYQEFC